MRRSLFVFASFFAVNAFALAPRTFVSTSGNDVNPCSRPAPCRSFAAAIAVTSPAGEVIALDSGGYGPVTINIAVTLVSPAGVYAAITAQAGQAITVDAGSNIVTLRGLTLNSLSGGKAKKAASPFRAFCENIIFSPYGSPLGLPIP